MGLTYERLARAKGSSFEGAPAAAAAAAVCYSQTASSMHACRCKKVIQNKYSHFGHTCPHGKFIFASPSWIMSVAAAPVLLALVNIYILLLFEIDM